MKKCADFEIDQGVADIDTNISELKAPQPAKKPGVFPCFQWNSTLSQPSSEVRNSVQRKKPRYDHSIWNHYQSILNDDSITTNMSVGAVTLQANCGCP